MTTASNHSRLFIYMKNLAYAEALAKTNSGMVRKTISELLGIMPLDGDRFWIDAHTDGYHSEMNGIDLAAKLQENLSEKTTTIIIYSWLPEAFVLKKCRMHLNLAQPNVHINRFPV